MRIPPIVAAGSLLAACGNTNPVDEIIAKTEMAKTHTVSIAQAKVRRVDRELVKSGKLEYPAWARYGLFTGHVDIEISDPTVTIIEQLNIEPLRQRMPRTLGKSARFTASFRIDPEPGTVVHIAYSKEDHEGKS